MVGEDQSEARLRAQRIAELHRRLELHIVRCTSRMGDTLCHARLFDVREPWEDAPTALDADIAIRCWRCKQIKLLRKKVLVSNQNGHVPCLKV